MDFIKDTEIVKILYGKLIGEISAEQQAVLEEWVNRSPKNRALYDDLISGDGVSEYEKMLANLDTRSRIDCIDRKIYKNRRHRRIQRITAVAAVLLAGVVSIALLYRGNTEVNYYTPPLERPQAILSFNDGREIRLTKEEQGTGWQKHIQAEVQSHHLKVVVPTGGEYYLKLSDSTEVWLNAKTVFEYPSAFAGDLREVFLSGEAYFEVATNEKWPFVVNTPKEIHVTVLGTSFNLAAYESDAHTVATLASGRVEVCSSRERVELVPGQQAVVDQDHRISIAQINVSHYVSWARGVFEFENMTLREIGKRLSRWYDVEFTFEGNTADERFTGGTWKYVPLNEFLRKIEYLNAVTFEYQDKQVIVKPAQQKK